MVRKRSFTQGARPTELREVVRGWPRDRASPWWYRKRVVDDETNNSPITRVSEHREF